MNWTHDNKRFSLSVRTFAKRTHVARSCAEGMQDNYSPRGISARRQMRVSSKCAHCVVVVLVVREGNDFCEQSKMVGKTTKYIYRLKVFIGL